MKKLTNYENAKIDIRKLRDYCLNPDHPIGKHKALVFKSTLGIEKRDAELLKRLILNELQNSKVYSSKSDEFGKRYTVNIKIRILDKEKIKLTAGLLNIAKTFRV